MSTPIEKKMKVYLITYYQSI